MQKCESEWYRASGALVFLTKLKVPYANRAPAAKFTELSDSHGVARRWEVMEKFLEGHQPKKHNLRLMVTGSPGDDILWITRTGSQWRNMESKYPAWQSVYYYFRQ